MRLHGTLKMALAVSLFTAQQAYAQTSVTVLPGPGPLIRGGAAATPAGDPAGWITDADYPPAAKAARQSGTVTFVVTVDADGMVSDCTVTKSSGSRLLDRATCSLISRRARFVAARNSDNEPSAAQWSSGVNWTLPQDSAAPTT